METQLTLEEVLKKYERYVHVTASRYSINEYQKEELVQAARIATWKAYNKYDSTKGDMHKYLIVYIKGSMMNYLTTYSRLIKVPAHKLDEEILVHSSNQKMNAEGEEFITTIEDEVEDNDDDDAQTHFKALLRHHLSKLNTQYQTILKLRYEQEMTFEQIANELNISRQATNTQYKMAMKKLKHYFGVED